MSDSLSPEDRAYIEKRAKETGRSVEEMTAVYVRMTSPGVAIIGGEVIGDHEAEAGGFKPATTWPEPDSVKDVDYPDTEAIKP